MIRLGLHRWWRVGFAVLAWVCLDLAPVALRAAESPADLPVGDGSPAAAAAPRIGKAERHFGWGWFRKEGYRDFIEPRVSFIKRHDRSSEVIEYSWRPMWLHDMPDRERIDQIRFSYNRYHYFGRQRRFFAGYGLGGNVILFNRALKDWGDRNGIDLEDGVNGLGRLMAGTRVSSVRLGKTVYPVVFRVDAFISPDYRFGGNLGHAGDRLELTEVQAGIAFSIE